MVNTCLRARLLDTISQIQSPHPQLPPLLGSHTLGHYPCPDHPRPGAASVPQSLLKLSKLATPPPAHPTYHGNHNKGACPQVPISPCLPVTPVLPGMAPVVWRALFSWDLCVINYLLDGSCFLIRWPCHTRTITKPIFKRDLCTATLSHTPLELLTQKQR